MAPGTTVLTATLTSGKVQDLSSVARYSIGEGKVVLNERAVHGFMLSTVWPPFEIDASKIL